MQSNGSQQAKFQQHVILHVNIPYKRLTNDEDRTPLVAVGVSQ